MASHSDLNPFLFYLTKDERLDLYRQILRGTAPIFDISARRVLATLLRHPSLMEELSVKDSKEIFSRASGITDDPWPLDEILDEEILQEELRARQLRAQSTDPSAGMSIVPLSTIAFTGSQPQSTDKATPKMAEHSHDPATAPASDPVIDDLVSALGSVPEDVEVSIRDIVSEPEDPSVQAAIISDTIANMPNSARAETVVPVIRVPFAASKAKGKAKVTDPDEASAAAPVAKRKLHMSGDVEFVSESRPSKRSEHRPTGLAQRPRLLRCPRKHFSDQSCSLLHWKQYGSNIPIAISLVEKNFSIEYLIRVCNIIPFLRAQNLLQTIQNVGAYSAWLIPEFYANLTSDSLRPTSPHYHQVFIRDVWYDFSPSIINAYFQRDACDDLFEPAGDFLASHLTHNEINIWPKDGLPSNVLTAVYSVLFRLASSNWIPNVSVHTVNKKMVSLLYKVRHQLPIDLGHLIYHHIMSFAKKNEAKIHLPFPCLITGILQQQGLQLYSNEELCHVTHKTSMDSCIFQRSHYDGRATLSSVPPAPAPADPPATGLDTTLATSATDSASTLAVLRQQVTFVTSHIATMKDASLAIQSSISTAEAQLLRTNRQIASIENASTAAPAGDDEDLETSSSSTQS
ncbi:PREDICTED: uncharacterized protein LOC109167433 [Ipomoea nil]|uniref:uncharacterized protein LOC109167433 n=1 Tax=Ipomoea nil TaxID=35883 RepID=UPI000900CF26|nr:PREDICTED: uncharacterized protein LOC109167433 [Ipomoea nil]